MTAAAPTPPLDLAAALSILCEDAFFAVAGSARLDPEMLRALSARRVGAIVGAARGARPPGLDSWEPWVLALAAALAPIAPPRWIPVADAVKEGLSLEHGARGLRSLFSSKPSDKDILRVRSLGALAVRCVTAVFGATGPLPEEAHLLRRALLASLGLSEETRRELEAEHAQPAESLDLSGDMDGKLARSIVRGCFYAARIDGTDPREEQAVISIARKLGLTTEAVAEVRDEARALGDDGKAFGDAAVDAVRYLFDADDVEGTRFATAAMRLTLTPIQRHDAITGLNLGNPVLLGKRHKLDRKQRDAVLGLAWVAAVHQNPTYIRRAGLVARHDKLAADLGDEESGGAVRTVVDRYVEQELGAVAKTATAA
jgi:hypothetical protein